MTKILELLFGSKGKPETMTFANVAETPAPQPYTLNQCRNEIHEIRNVIEQTLYDFEGLKRGFEKVENLHRAASDGDYSKSEAAKQRFDAIEETLKKLEIAIANQDQAIGDLRFKAFEVPDTDDRFEDQNAAIRVNALRVDGLRKSIESVERRQEQLAEMLEGVLTRCDPVEEKPEPKPPRRFKYTEDGETKYGIHWGKSGHSGIVADTAEQILGEDEFLKLEIEWIDPE